MRRPLTVVVHGEAGTGKSWFADTAPAPRVVLDAEGGVRFTPSRKVLWDPKEEPPVPDGTWDTAVVPTLDLETVQRAFSWAQTGRHPFVSWTIDSLTEVQKRAKDVIAGANAMRIQDYGTLKRRIEALVRAFRDLTLRNGPTEVVVFVCGTQERGIEHAVMRPLMEGSITNEVGYYVDVLTSLSVAVGPDGTLERRALFAPIDGVAAKDRTGKLGVTMDNPSIPAMLDLIYGPDEEEA